jgi:hypothetical protein
VKKFIFRYLSVPLTDGYSNIFMHITNKDIPNNSSLRVVDELNKFLNNVCIIWVNKHGELVCNVRSSCDGRK